MSLMCDRGVIYPKQKGPPDRNDGGKGDLPVAYCRQEKKLFGLEELGDDVMTLQQLVKIGAVAVGDARRL